jgi:hypothetical protein
VRRVRRRRSSVVRGNPYDDISATLDIDQVWLADKPLADTN